MADVAVFTGEEIPRRAVLPESLVSTLPGLVGADVVAREAERLANRGQPQREMPDGVTHSANMADPEDWVDPLGGYAYDSSTETLCCAWPLCARRPHRAAGRSKLCNVSVARAAAALA